MADLGPYGLKQVDKFKADLNKVAELFGTTVGVVRRRVALEIWTGVVKKSPVKTGRFRASWNFTEGHVDASVKPEGKHGSPHPPALRSNPDNFTVTWITNNLPYAVPLEEGHSQKAPFGMVRVTLAEVEVRLELEVHKAIQQVFSEA